MDRVACVWRAFFFGFAAAWQAPGWHQHFFHLCRCGRELIAYPHVASRMVVGSVLARASCTLPLGRCGSEGNAAQTARTGLHGQGGEATMKQAPAHVTATCTGPRGREDGKTVRGKAASRGHHGWRLEAGTLPPGRVGNKGSAAQQRTGLHGRGGGEDAAASTITRDSNLHWASWP